MANYSISEEAIRDLDEISDYFASRSIEAGERFVKRFADKCKNLVKFPNIGRIYTEILPNLRGIPLDGYIILYQVVQKDVEIVRVVSGYRDLESLFSEDEDN